MDAMDSPAAGIPETAGETANPVAEKADVEQQQGADWGRFLDAQPFGDTSDETARLLLAAVDERILAQASGTSGGLVLALIEAGRAEEAAKELATLTENAPNTLEYLLADAELHLLRGEAALAVEQLQRQLRLRPGNHPLTMAYARALMRDQKPHIAESVLVEQSKQRPNDPGLWYLLAEVQGLAGNILGLHQSRAEYFILNGVLDQAEQQLGYALKLAGTDHVTSSRINARLADIAEMRERMEGF